MNEPQALYISGPMRNVPGFNHEQFAEVASALRVRFPRATIYNPAENFDGRTDLDYHVYMTVDLGQVLMSDAIVFLPGWDESEGAVEEARVGLATGKQFYRAIKIRAAWQFWAISPESVKATVLGFDPDVAAERRSEAAARQPNMATSWAESYGDNGTMRTFDTGATRDTSDGKLNYEGFLSPLVLEAYAEYMNEKRIQSDGTLRSGDNWQKGIPLNAYADSMWRHFMDVWKAHRGYPIKTTHLEALMALLFNVMGYAHELMVAQARDADEPLADWERELLEDDELGQVIPELQALIRRYAPEPQSVADFNGQVTQLAETIRKAMQVNPFPGFRIPGRDA